MLTSDKHEQYACLLNIMLIYFAEVHQEQLYNLELR